MVGIRFVVAAVLFAGSCLGNPNLRSELLGETPPGSSITQSPESKKAAGKPQPEIVPNAYIVQLHTNGPLTKRAADLHAEFHLAAKRDARLDYSVRETFSADSIFVGLSLTLKDGDVQALKDLDNVADIWPIKIIPAPSAAIPLQPLTARYDTVPVAGTDFSLPYFTGDLDVNRPHQQTRVDKAHAAGVKGKGVKIAILDTGVDYRHPSLGGGFGEGHKIAFGYDFVGDDYYNQAEDADPLVTCNSGGHGTHVSGIIGMQDLPGTGYGLIGVAPEATIGMYRIFSCVGGAATDVIMKALLQAAADGADVISMSFGQLWADEESNPYEALATNLVDQGVALFAAAGNSGNYGIFGGSAPALSTDVFAVGSVDNEKYPVTYQLIDSNGRSLRYSAHLPQDSPPEGLIVQVVNYGGEDWQTTGAYYSDYDGAYANLTAAGIDPATVILATKYGDVAPETKASVASTYGYKYFLSYATESEDPWYGQEYYTSESDDIPIDPITLTVQDSKTLLSSYGKHPLGYKINLSSTNYVAKSTVASTGGFASNYTSLGPTAQFDIKPQLSAVGGNILATWPLGFGYAIISGTSMSTPFMSASYALVKSKHPELKVREIYALLQNSGTPLNWYYNQNIKSAAIQQGAGLLNVQNALAWESHVIPTQLNAGLATDWDTWNNVVTLNFTITNRSPRSKTYTFSHTPAGLMQNIWWEEETYNNMYPFYGSVKFHSDSVLIPAGKSSVVSVDIIAPVPDTATWGDWAINLEDPIYSGFITVHNNYETYTIPYAGELWNSCRWDSSC